MAVIRSFFGFEGGENDLHSALTGACFAVGDGTARTGDFYLKILSTAVATLNTQLAVPTLGTLGQALGDGEAAKGIIRFFFRPRRLPSATIGLGGWGWHGDATANSGRINLDSTGHFAAAAGNTASAYSAAALALNVWYRIEVTTLITNPPAGWDTNDTTVSVYDAAGNLVDTKTIQVTTTAATGFRPPLLGWGWDTATFEGDYDDVFWIAGEKGDVASVVLPAATHVSPVYITGQGASADWTGVWQNARPIPRNSSVVDTYQTDGTAGHATTFTKPTVATLGVASIVATKVVGHIKASVAGNDALIWNAAETAVAVAVAYPTGSLCQYLIDWSALGDAAWDAAEFGAVNKRGATLSLAKVYGEVLHAGTPIPRPEIAGEKSWRHQCGTFTRTAAFQTIAGVGFRPQITLIKRVDGVTGSASGVIRLGCMGGTLSKPLGVSVTTGNPQWPDALAIMAVNDDGFELGPSTTVYEDGKVYEYICIRDGGAAAEGYYCTSGILVGNTVDSRDIVTPAGFTPELVITFGGTLAVYRDTSFAGDASMRLGNDATITDQIQALNADGFQVGASALVNTAQLFVPYVAFRLGAIGKLDGFFAFGSFTAAAGTHTVSGLAFQPHFVMGDRPNTGDAAWRAADIGSHAGANSNNWNALSLTATGVTSLTADGFTCGAQLSVNTETTRWLALLDQGEVFLDTDLSQCLAEVFTRVVWDPCVTPGVGEDLCGKRNPLLWVEWKPGDSTTRVFAEVALPDALTYHEGYKEPRLLSVSEVRRALAGANWDYEVGRWSARFADTDRVLRTILSAGAGQYWTLRELALYAISDVGRRAQLTPRLMGWGLVDPDIRLPNTLEVEVPVKDVIGSMPGWGLSLTDLIPKRRICAPEFANARPEVRDFGVPAPYGTLTDEESASAPPVWDGDPARGAIYDAPSDTWTNGWGDLPNPPAPPANLVLAEGAAGGDFGTDSHGNLDFYVFVTAVDVNGTESDPEPFLPSTTSITLSAATKTVEASWNASVDAVKYRCYLGWLYYSIWHTQYLETTDLFCEFTKNPIWGTFPITQADITPGAATITYGNQWYYSVLAVLADGRTVLSTAPGLNYSGFGYSGPFRRPVRCQWLAVAGATSYEVYRRAAGGDWTRKWTVAAPTLYLDDDQLDTGAEIVDGVPQAVGAVTPIYVGDATIEGEAYAELLVAGCAIYDIRHWYWDDGVNPVEVDSHDGDDFLIPFNAGWAAHFLTPYRDVLGSDGQTYRRTPIYVRNFGGRTRKDELVAGTATLRVNLDGIEDVGSSTGVLITDLYQQAAHFLTQWVIASYETGNWSDPPMFPDTSVCQVNCPSFTTLTNLRRAELPPDGYVGAVLVGTNGERISAGEWLTRWMKSGEFRLGPNRAWQIVAKAIDEALDVTTLDDVIDSSEVEDPTGDPQPRRAELVNEVTYRYGPDLVPSGSTWLGEVVLPDATSIVNNRETVRAELELWCVRQSAVAAHVAQRYLNRSKTIPVYVEPEGDLCLDRFDLGDAFNYTHFRGLGSSGFVDTPVWVVGHTFLPSSRRVRLECLNLTPILTPGGP